jgi:hypothetical protein
VSAATDPPAVSAAASRAGRVQTRTNERTNERLDARASTVTAADNNTCLTGAESPSKMICTPRRVSSSASGPSASSTFCRLVIRCAIVAPPPGRIPVSIAERTAFSASSARARAGAEGRAERRGEGSEGSEDGGERRRRRRRARER